MFTFLYTSYRPFYIYLHKRLKFRSLHLLKLLPRSALSFTMLSYSLSLSLARSPALSCLLSVDFSIYFRFHFIRLLLIGAFVTEIKWNARLRASVQLWCKVLHFNFSFSLQLHLIFCFLLLFPFKAYQRISECVWLAFIFSCLFLHLQSWHKI